MNGITSGFLVLAAAMVCSGASLSRAAAVTTVPSSPIPPPGPETEAQGRIVCIPELLHQAYGTELAGEHEHLFGFQTSNGTVYTLLRTKFSDALFVDARLRAKELLLKGRVFPQSQILEVTRIRSIRNGVVQDLFYYCTVCSIEMISAGPCACCQGAVELHEVPLRPPSAQKPQEKNGKSRRQQGAEK
ncbi:MAG: hypothetical protein U1G07_04355 [Verrucomicrobiota bacterium]